MKRIGEYCGLCGVVGVKKSNSALVAEGLFAQQHRGQEAAGIATLSRDRADILPLKLLEKTSTVNKKSSRKRVLHRIEPP